jgi:hypothetical protein
MELISTSQTHDNISALRTFYLHLPLTYCHLMSEKGLSSESGQLEPSISWGLWSQTLILLAQACNLEHAAATA